MLVCQGHSLRDGDGDGDDGGDRGDRGDRRDDGDGDGVDLD